MPSWDEILIRFRFKAGKERSGVAVTPCGPRQPRRRILLYKVSPHFRDGASPMLSRYSLPKQNRIADDTFLTPKCFTAYPRKIFTPNAGFFSCCMSYVTLAIKIKSQLDGIFLLLNAASHSALCISVLTDCPQKTKNVEFMLICYFWLLPWDQRTAVQCIWTVKSLHGLEHPVRRPYVLQHLIRVCFSFHMLM